MELPSRALALRGLEWLLGALTWLAGAAGALAVAVLVALGAWMASPHSLGQALNWAATWLARDGAAPLQVQGAEGSLLRGGTVAQLGWTQDTLSLQAQGVELRWRAGMWWHVLAGRTLALELVAAEQVQVQTRPDPNAEPRSPDADTPPWQGPLSLPWLDQVELPFEVSGQADLTLGASALPPLLGLRGRYVYGVPAGEAATSTDAAGAAEPSATTHQLVLDHLRWADGSYQLDVALQATAPFALRGQLQGMLSPRWDSEAASAAASVPLQLEATATLHGQLGTSAGTGADAAALPTTPFIDVTAQVAPTTANAPTLSAEARLQPWRSQPVQNLQAQLEQLDAALFWPGAPRTALSGLITTTPGTSLSEGWGLNAQLQNRRPGPWDQMLLPLERIDVELRQDATGWRMPRLEAQLAGTVLRAQGRAEGLFEPGGLRAWTLEANAGRLVPARVLSTLQAVPQDFALNARSMARPTGAAGAAVAEGDGPGVGLQVALAPARGAVAHAGTGIPLPAVNLRGTWLPGQLRLDAAEMRWQEARLDAKGTLAGLPVGANLAASGGQAAQPTFTGEATLSAPGLGLSLAGTLDAAGHAGSAGVAGGGGDGTHQGVNLRVDIQNASVTLAWVRRTLERLDTALAGVWDAPPWQAALPGDWDTLAVAGSAALSASWSDEPPWAAMAAALRAGSGGSVEPASPMSPGSTRPRSTRPGNAWSVNLAVDGASFQAAPGAARWQVPTARTSLDGGRDGSGTGSSARHWRLDHTGTASGPMGEADVSVAASQSEISRLTLGWQQDGAPLRVQLARPVAYRLLAPTAAASSQPVSGLELAPGQLLLELLAPDGARQVGIPIDWDRMVWTGDRLQSEGRWQDLPLAALDRWLALRSSSAQGAPSPLAAAGLETTLVLQGDWTIDLPLAEQAPTQAPPRGQAQIQIRRQSGDFTLPPELTRQQRLPAALRESSVTLQLSGQQLQASVRWASERMGDITAQLDTELAPPTAQQGWHWPATAPTTATARATLPDLSIWSALAPPGWRVQGLLALDVEAGGTRASPDWRGNIVADGLTLRSVVDGIDLRDGQLRARFTGRQLDITSLRLVGAGGDGVLEGTGSAVWTEKAGLLPDVDLQLKATAMRVLSRADRRLTLSGDTRMALRGQDLQIDSTLRVDQALFLLPDEATPSLGSDVVVLETEGGASADPGSGRSGGASGTSGAARPLRLSLNATLDLGREFVLRGQGLNTGLRGRLQITRSPGAALPRVTGEIRTADGTYRAYGQVLQIEAGVLRFIGPYDNPTLDILAVRTLPNQRAGVRILGTAQAPRVRLYADPDVPDSEKLALLVLGRPLSGAGAEAAILQQAALALLSGQDDDRSLVQALGLDELSFQGESQLQDGSTTAAAITLGKRISNRLYVAYNRSLAGAVGTVQVFYDVSRRVTLRAQAGDDNALDLIFTVNYD